MPEVALALYAVYVAVAFGLRSWLLRRRTGSAGFHGISGRPGSLEWLAGVAFVVALVLGLVAPVLGVTGALEPVDALDGSAGHVVGLVLALAGIGLTLAAQAAMGASWRIGVDAEERTALVTQGPFALVRNPFFAALIPTSLGLTLLVPNWVSLLGLLALAVALELQVRLVEEPYLRRAHGPAYAAYAARVGRFLPGVGRLRA